MKTLFTLRAIDIEDEEIDFTMLANELDIHPEVIEIADEANLQDAVQVDAFHKALDELVGGLDNTFMSLDGDLDVYDIDGNYLVVQRTFHGLMLISCSEVVRKRFDKLYNKHL